MELQRESIIKKIKRRIVLEKIRTEICGSARRFPCPSSKEELEKKRSMEGKKMASVLIV
jgi:hypothetical protein